jgi:hypothetical protein
MASFPKPITRKELAKEAGVSTAAISKLGNRLLKLVDWNVLVLGHKLILKSYETFGKLLGFYFLQMRPTKILLSNYGSEMIKRMNIHSKISEGFKEYPIYFTENDTLILTRIVLYNLGNFQIVDKIKTSISDPQQRMTLLSTQFGSALQSVLQKLDLPMEKVEDLLSILAIRDKLFYLVRELVCKQVQKAEIFKELSEKKKATYLSVYMETIDFYLRKVFRIGTNFIKQTAKEKNIEFKEKYDQIGLFYAPPPK